ncbi:UDP-glucuronosyltransferase 2B13-like isoform X1 [Thrips palmi]|uniref:UDP-glucuronosyltransferase n=1 Tax=Thrips palmi TaxID=161013 RepID=A0A6P8Y858_THRPL|nr:UDP-glucuronosyltransferase 2B13-like isoform X1 [Thrips palmi]
MHGGKGAKQAMQCTLLLLLAAGLADAARILAVFAMKGQSHTMVNDPLVRGLAARGHTVDVYGHFVPAEPVANVQYFKLERAGTLAPGLDIKAYEHAYTKFVNPIKLMSRGIDDCEALFSDPGVQRLLSSNTKYDLFITELFNTDCYLAFGHRFQVPVVVLSTSPILPWGNWRFGNPDNPAYIPNMYSGSSDTMTLLERGVNALQVVYTNVIKTLYFDPIDQAVMERALGKALPPVAEMARNTSLLLVNTFHALTLPRPHTVGVVEVGGIHITRPDPAPLPKDLEQFVGGAKDGVILFSLGSMIRTSSLPQESAVALLRALGTLKQRVVWKWEGEAPGPVPKNVRLSKWLPQFDVLCHNNTRLFIGHGGLLSTSEAAHCGVPLLGIAMYGDQRTNLAAVAKHGAGRSLPYSALKNADVFIKHVRELLDDPSYQQNAEVLSQRFRDRPMSPLDTAVYWTEYVIRHKGAPHLRGAARNLAWYQEALLDVLAVVVLGLAAALYVLFAMVRAVLRLVLRATCGSCDNKDAKKKKA